MMSLSTVTDSPAHRLHLIVKAIPEGEISGTARRAGLTYRYMQKIRTGPVDVGANKLAALCVALGKSADELLGLKPPDPLSVEVERQRETIAALQRANEGLRKTIAQLVQLPPLPQSAAGPPRRPPTSRKE